MIWNTLLVLKDDKKFRILIWVTPPSFTAELFDKAMCLAHQHLTFGQDLRLLVIRYPLIVIELKLHFLNILYHK